MTRRFLAPVALMVAAGGCAAVVLTLHGGSPFRVLAALLLLFVLPGAASVTLLRPSSGRLGASGILFGAALSIALVILISAALYVAGVRLGLHSWTIAAGAVTVLLSAAAAVRDAPERRRRRPRLAWRVVLPLLAGALIAAGLLAGATLATVNSVRHRERRDHFTQLWALPAASGGTAAAVGISNHEGSSRGYTVRVSIDGHVAHSQRLELASGRTWSTEQHYPAGVHSIRIALSMTGAPRSPYRWVELHFGPKT